MKNKQVEGKPEWEIETLTIRGNTLDYWKQNAEDNYNTTPISVLKYITVLEECQPIGNPEQLKATLPVAEIGETAEEMLKSRGFKNPPLDSGISGGGSAESVRVSDMMEQYASLRVAQALKK